MTIGLLGMLLVGSIIVAVAVRAIRSKGGGDRESTSERLYGGADRPAGPDAEAMDPERLGGDQHPPDA